MSEQNQSNFQALGAGLLGFVAVLAVGGGALMVHSSQQSKAAAQPAPAAAPIDIGAPVTRFESPAPRPQSERRAESPAPLIGSQDEAEGAAEAPANPQAAASSSSSSPEAAPTESARLKATAHLEASGGSTAEAVVKNTIVAEKAAVEKAPAKLKAEKKPVKLGPVAGTEVASVHYGVTSRSELMGRAAGPVYNIKGGDKVGSAPMGKMADDVNAKVSDLKTQLEATGLPASQREKLLKDLAEATKGMKTEKPQ